MCRVRMLAAICVAAAMMPLGLSADTSNISVTVFVAQCTDGIDNDGDSLIDHGSDPGCSSTGDDDETDPVLAACQDGADNDGDSLIDYPADPGCDSAGDASEANLTSGGGGGGGGGGTWTNSIAVTPAPQRMGTVLLSGHAPAHALVRLFVDAKPVSEVRADEDGAYAGEMQAAAGGRTLGIIAQDQAGRYTAYLSIPIVIAADSRTSITGVLLSPTLAYDASRGTIIGSVVPGSRVAIDIDGERFEATVSGGTYELSLAEQIRSAESLVRVLGELRGRGLPASVPIRASRQVSAPERLRADLSGDRRVDLTDFSVLLYWFRRELSPAILEREKTLFNGDGRLDFTDFSIMAYHWTG